MFPKGENYYWGGQKELHIISQVPCLAKTIEGILIYPFEVVYIQKVRPPSVFACIDTKVNVERLDSGGEEFNQRGLQSKDNGI